MTLPPWFDTLEFVVGRCTVMAIDDDSPQWLSDYRAIEVDLRGLADFGTAIKNAADRNFAPHAALLKEQYAGGVQFGAANPSGAVYAARLKYHDCLTAMAQQLDSYIEASKSLADAVQTAVERYGDADARSKARVGDIEALLSEADALAAARRAAGAAIANDASHRPPQRFS
jgi:hypothetical protein